MGTYRRVRARQVLPVLQGEGSSIPCGEASRALAPTDPVLSKFLLGSAETTHLVAPSGHNFHAGMASSERQASQPGGSQRSTRRECARTARPCSLDRHSALFRVQVGVHELRHTASSYFLPVPLRSGCSFFRDSRPGGDPFPPKVGSFWEFGSTEPICPFSRSPATRGAAPA